MFPQIQHGLFGPASSSKERKCRGGGVVATSVRMPGDDDSDAVDEDGDDDD